MDSVDPKLELVRWYSMWFFELTTAVAAAPDDADEAASDEQAESGRDSLKVSSDTQSDDDDASFRLDFFVFSFCFRHPMFADISHPRKDAEEQQEEKKKKKYYQATKTTKSLFIREKNSSKKTFLCWFVPQFCSIFYQE